MERFDAAAFGIGVSEALLIDPQQRLMLEVSGSLGMVLVIMLPPGLASLHTGRCWGAAHLAHPHAAAMVTPATCNEPPPLCRVPGRCWRPMLPLASRSTLAMCRLWRPSPSGTMPSRPTAHCLG